MCVRKLNKALKNFYNYLRWMVNFLFKIWLSYFNLKKYSKCVENKNRCKNINAQNFNEFQIQRIIPMSKGRPIIGTLFDLIAAGGATHLHIYIDRRHKEFGSIFQERLGISGKPYVFVSSASLMRSVFLYEGQFPRHPLPEAWILYNETFKCERGLFFMENIEWLHNRRLLNRFLLNGNLKWMDSHIETSTMRLINEWKQKAPTAKSKEKYKIPHLENRLYRWAVDVICTIMFGQDVIEYPEIDAALEEFSKIVHNVFEKSTALMDFPPILAKLLKLRIWQDFELNVRNVLQMGGIVIDKFVELLKDTNPTDDFTNIQENGTLYQRLQSANVSLELIKRIFVDLVIAAGDTTAYTTTWALFLISQNNSLQQKLFKDVLKYGIESPLITGLIKETLRMYPVAPFIGRFMDTDAAVEGYRIDKNTLVLLSLFTAGRDSEHFPDPLSIKPERWLRDKTSGEFIGVNQAHGSLPFAIGNRSCIGRKIAMKQMQCLLVALIDNFEMHYGNKETLEPILRLVTVPSKALKLLINYREDC